MHRKLILDLLDHYQDSSPEQLILKNRIITFIKKYKNCFDRTLEKGHLTGSAWLVNANQTKVLLTYHRKLKKWVQLGGHADGENDLLKVALTEAQEESGIKDLIPLSWDIFDIDIHVIPSLKDEKSHFHYDIRFIIKSDIENFKLSLESIELKWFTFDQILDLNLELSVLRMAYKWQEKFKKN